MEKHTLVDAFADAMGEEDLMRVYAYRPKRKTDIKEFIHVFVDYLNREDFAYLEKAVKEASSGNGGSK